MALIPEDSNETVVLDGRTLRSLGEGTMLGNRYRIAGELGRGGMGIVYRATDHELLRDVAVKVVSEASLPGVRQRLLREARAAAALNHPHIVSVYDVGDTDGSPFFVMELVTGASLRHAPPESFDEIVAVAEQLCDALGHAHEQGLVHRDLKPDNVLQTGRSGKRLVKLADLGLATGGTGSRLTQAGMIVGTADYMSPEQAMGKAVDGRADLYSLGVMLYEWTTGRLPFLGNHPLAVISQHVNAPVVPPRAIRPEMPGRLEAAILRLLAKDPDGRFATASETAEALRASLGDDATAPSDEPVASIALLDALSRGRMVAREDELTEIRELWRRARGGRGHGALISGEPGAGKSRLARELVIQASLDGAVVLQGGCYEYEATTPYLPFAEAFRRWAHDQKDDATLRLFLGENVRQLTKLVPELETRLGPFAKPSELPANEERILFFSAVAEVLRALAGSRGLLLYLDDLHWADSSTLWLLTHLLRNLKDDRVLILGCYRETELDRAHPLSKSLVDWNRERLTTRTALKRFSAGETRAQLAALLGQEVSIDFSSIVHRETDGNPFFIEEVVKALIEQGMIFRGTGRWERADTAELRIPQSVKEAIGHRLNRVTPACNDVLRAAAVIGKTFTFAELAAADDHSEDELLDALDDAVNAQLLVPAGGDAFSFTHDKIREVLYEEMNVVRRRRLHRRIAEGLETLRGNGSNGGSGGNRGDKPVAIEKLAYHYIEAGDHKRGLACAKEAGQLAERLSAFDEALHAYGQALDCAEALGLEDEVLGLEEAMGKACMAGGEGIAAIEHFEKALALATEPEVRARLLCDAAASLVHTGDARGLDYLREAFSFLDEETHPLETAYALTTEARFHHLAGRHRKAVELLERAEKLAGVPGAGAELPAYQGLILTMAYAYLAGAYQHLGLYADGDRWASRAIDFGKTYGQLHAQASGYEFLGENATLSRNWVKGLEYVEKERAVLARLHSRERLAWSYLVHGICLVNLGENTQGEQALREGMALADSLGEKRLRCLLSGSLAILEADSGRLDDALRTATDNLAAAEQIGLLHMRADGRRCLAHVLWKRGELVEAARLCEETVTITAATESRSVRLGLGPLHVDILLALNRCEEAAATLEAYAEIVAGCQAPNFTAIVSELRARVAESNGG